MKKSYLSSRMILNRFKFLIFTFLLVTRICRRRDYFKIDLKMILLFKNFFRKCYEFMHDFILGYFWIWYLHFAININITKKLSHPPVLLRLLSQFVIYFKINNKNVVQNEMDACPNNILLSYSNYITNAYITA